jgi:hypothetical protein
MNGEFNFEAMLDAIATRLAVKLRADQTAAGETAHIKPRLLNVDQAAAYLSRSPQALRHMVATGKLSSVRFDGRVYLDVKDLDAAIENAKENAL